MRVVVVVVVRVVMEKMLKMSRHFLALFFKKNCQHRFQQIFFTFIQKENLHFSLLLKVVVRDDDDDFDAHSFDEKEEKDEKI